MRKILVLFFLAAVVQTVSAQRKITLQPGYAFVNGSESNASQYSLDAYYRFRALSVGFGGGLDAHYMQSVPLYVTTQKIIGKETMRLVAYANGGMNLPTLKESQKKPDTRFSVDGEYKSGYYFDLGGGFAFMLRHNRAIFLTCGYSGKSLREVYNGAYRSGDYVPPESGQKHTFKYNLQRIVVRVKVQIW